MSSLEHNDINSQIKFFMPTLPIYHLPQSHKTNTPNIQLTFTYKTKAAFINSLIK